MTLTLKHKLVIASLGISALPLLAASQGASGVQIARALLGLAAVAGIGWWLLHARRTAPFQLAPRLSLVQRVGLSQRTGLAMVEADGQCLLIVHGDGFARIERIGAALKPELVTTRVTTTLSAVDGGRR